MTSTAKNNILDHIYNENIGKTTMLGSDKEVWKDIYSSYQYSQIIKGIITGIEKGSSGENNLLINFNGSKIKGIIPESETGIKGDEDKKLGKMRKLIGQNTVVKVKGIDKKNNIVALSRKEALEHMGNLLIRELKVGEIRKAKTIMVTRYYAVVDIGGIETTLPKSEITYGYVTDVRDYIKTGDIFDIKILSIDRENKSVKISHKALCQDGWETIEEDYKIGGEYLAIVTGIEEYGMFINLKNSNGISALIQLPKNKEVRHMIKIGNNVLFKITAIDKEKRYIRGKLIRVIV